MIKIEHLAKRFGDLEVLKDINLEIGKGQVVTIIGPSGSGKSTLLRCLNLLERPDKGVISYNGKNILDPDVKIENIRRKACMVFQHFNLFANMTVLRNVTYAPMVVNHLPKDEAVREGMKYLTMVGLADKADQYPSRLSGGQKQRVAIARAITMVLVTHEMGFAKDVSDWIHFMDGGYLIESAPPQEFFAHPKTDRAKKFLSHILS